VVLIVKSVELCATNVQKDVCLQDKRAEMNLYIGAVAGGASEADIRDTYAAVVAVDTVVANTVTNIATNVVKK
jgi:hypothetical protein